MSDQAAITPFAESRAAGSGRPRRTLSHPVWAAPPSSKETFLGATSPKGPLVQARAVFGGVAPAPPVLRPACTGRPARITNPLPDKALA